MPDTQYIQGLSDLEKKLQMLTDVGRDKDTRKVLRRSVSQGAKIFQDEMKLTAPRQTEPRARGSGGARFGPLFSKIRRSVRFLTRESAVLARVGPNKDTRWYASFFEFGTSRQPARPWLRPLFDRKAPQALSKTTQELTEGVLRVVPPK